MGRSVGESGGDFCLDAHVELAGVLDHGLHLE
jgi:hypothetical protein